MTERTVEDAIGMLLDNSIDRCGVLGPVVHEIKAVKKRWYCMFVTRPKDREHSIIKIVLGTKPLEKAEEDRAGLLLDAFQRAAHMIHDTDSELYMAQLCNTLWPCAKFQEIEDGITRDQRKGGQQEERI